MKWLNNKAEAMTRPGLTLNGWLVLVNELIRMNKQKREASLAPAHGSTSARFKKLFDDAKKSPTYWLEGLDLHFSESIIRYKQRQKRTPNIEKRKNLGSKIRSLKECLQDVRRSMKDYEKMSNSEVRQAGPDVIQ